MRYSSNSLTSVQIILMYISVLIIVFIGLVFIFTGFEMATKNLSIDPSFPLGRVLILLGVINIICIIYIGYILDKLNKSRS